MPVAHIHLLKGHSRVVLRTIIAKVTEAMSRVLNAPKERFMVWVTEIDPELWGIEGRPASEALTAQDRNSVEMPFVEMVLMEGRPLAQYHAVIEEVSAAIAEALQSDRSRVRVHLVQAQPDYWGIGGVPYSILRADEIAARLRATA
ncbi:tautomerase family protein [Rhodoblastus acidophilus]|uniref:Tautomerase family protein n=1 Tax=Candidatus Rhodoblastus alkanivorans TaxID=2954117 RepID=A0ABS9Z5L2_9HYPH|nr:tautomerase family protein [Candidatus Rhodoblastus alkanivorans]MCI4679983.1 tautomerase family protein [Candidatus Rhodoblastus alkanivorans]MCI4682366.1 tautomerase family protein [Candidatus Rhodoblastus alkanivorans]MDI4639669.1 tautomerase family protein [Rhodoblastus acidophilus]